MIKSFEGLRGTAAIIVALYHLKVAATYVAPIAHGYIFVDLFFVLSGYVIASAYFQRLESVHQAAAFMLRRFGRLYPLHIATAIMFLFADISVTALKRLLVATGQGHMLRNPGDLGFHLPTFSQIASTFTLTQGMGLHDSLFLNSVSWSISVEFWAYAVFALLCIAFRRSVLIMAFLSASMFAVSVWASIYQHNCLHDGGCMNLVDGFAFSRCLASFMLGVIVWRARGAAREFERVVQVIAVAGTLSLFFFLSALPAIAFLLPLCFAAVIWSLAMDTGPIAGVLSTPFFTKLGERSYSIYMLHPVLLFGFFEFVQRVTGFWSGAVTILAYLAVLYLAAGLSYRFIEHPARLYFNRQAGRIDALLAQQPPGTAV